MVTADASAQGLSTKEAEKRFAEYGPNLLKIPRRVTFGAIFKEEVQEPMILLLLVVAVFYTLWGKVEDALTIFVVITLLVFAEVWNEYRAKKAVNALSIFAAPKTKSIRDGKVTEIDTENIVPGDVLILAPGTRIAADCTCTASFSLEVDESSLTGESYPQEKGVSAELYAGTMVVSGQGMARVVSTAKNTRMGKIYGLSLEIKPPKTALQLAMKSLAKSLVKIAVFFSLLIMAVGILRGNDPKEMVLVGLALAFATIPEELPIIITMILGLGSYKLSKEKFLVKKLKAAETLGDATVILTDKTGTITESRMSVVSVYPKGKEKDVLRAVLSSLTAISLSATDKALRGKASALGLRSDSSEILRERSFGNGRKTMSLLRKTKKGLMLFTIGAPEEILKMSEGGAPLRKVLDEEAGKGRRVIAVALRPVPESEKQKPFETLEKNLAIAGLISLEDPPREGVKDTIGRIQRAGIRTIMVTGDHAKTAAFIAKSVGIPFEKILTGEEIDRLSDAKLQSAVKEVSVFARATPEQKYRLVNALHRNGEVVAVTGDGVNDSLALKSADIGISMGVKGTDAAKEASDAVLADDNFVTIGKAVFEGRKFYDNLRKGVKYYLSVKVALVLVFLMPLLLGLPLPFAPIQIIILELFMDLAASAGFVAEPSERAIYTRPPQRGGTFLGSLLPGIFASGTSLFAAVTLTYGYALSQGMPLVRAQSFAFVAWMIGHILLAYISRSEKETLFALGPFSNRIMNLWASLVFAFLLAAMVIPSVGSNVRLITLTLEEVATICVISILALLPLELKKICRRKTGKRAG